MPTWTSNIPSQVKTFADLSAFPITGSVKTIYIAEDSNIAYYWTGSAYQSISIQDLSGLFPNPTGTTSQYIRGDGSLETFPTIPDVSGLVPYTGANANVDLGEFGLEAGFIEFDTTPTNTPTTQGTLSWDVDDETLQLVMNGSIMKLGEDQYYPVKNQTGVSIPKGTAVRFDGTVGGSGRLLIAPYIADGSVPNSVFMGVTAETIDNGDDGKVMWFGRIRGINTNAFEEGDILYASPTTAGGFTTVPNNKVQVCAVITKSINNGTIFVRPSIFPTTAEIGAVPTSRNLTINGVTQDLSADRSFTAIVLTGQPNGVNAGISGAIRYFGFSGSNNATNELLRRVFLPNACTLKNFYIRTSGTQPASGSHVLTILKNGLATSIQVTIPAGSGGGVFADTTNSASFLAGDEISIEAQNNASSNSSILASFSIGHS